jgi:hypothetical protein
MRYSAEYEEVRDEAGNAGWLYRILKDGEVVAVSPQSSPFAKKMHAQIFAEEAIMRMEEADSEADAG